MFTIAIAVFYAIFLFSLQLLRLPVFFYKHDVHFFHLFELSHEMVGTQLQHLIQI